MLKYKVCLGHRNKSCSDSTVINYFLLHLQICHLFQLNKEQLKCFNWLVTVNVHHLNSSGSRAELDGNWLLPAGTVAKDG